MEDYAKVPLALVSSLWTMRGWTFIVWFACGGLIAPSLWAAYGYLLPNSYHFEGTTEFVLEFVFLVLLWPAALPTMMAMDFFGGSRAISTYIFGTLINVVWYALLGGLIWAATNIFLRRKH